MECKLPLWTWVNNYSLHQPWTFFTKRVGMNLLKVNLTGLERWKLKNKSNSPIQTTSSLLDLHWQQKINGVHVVSFSLTGLLLPMNFKVAPYIGHHARKKALLKSICCMNINGCVYFKKSISRFSSDHPKPWSLPPPILAKPYHHIYIYAQKPLPHAQMTLL